jgi:hypothetical protein
MTKQESNFIHDLVRFAVTVLLLALIVLWARSGGPTIQAIQNDTPANTSATDAR